MPRKLTQAEFEEKLRKQNKHAQDIELLEDYVGSQLKIKVKCKKCGHEWTPKANNLLLGHGCPKCNNVTYEQFINRLQQVNPNIEIRGTYINITTKVNCKCKKCEHEWKATPDSLLHRHGCPKCAGNIKLTQEKFITKLHQVNPDIKVLGTYINNSTKIKCKCMICDHEWEAAPKHLLSGHGCPKCNTSQGEKRIAQYLDNLGIHYIYDKPYFNDLFGIGGRLLRPDFIIPSLKIWIEFDGIQHFKPVDFAGNISKQQIQLNFKLVQQNDQIKDQYAKDNNWTLIRIPYTEYDNIEQILAGYLN